MISPFFQKLEFEFLKEKKREDQDQDLEGEKDSFLGKRKDLLEEKQLISEEKIHFFKLTEQIAGVNRSENEHDKPYPNANENNHNPGFQIPKAKASNRNLFIYFILFLKASEKKILEVLEANESIGLNLLKIQEKDDEDIFKNVEEKFSEEDLKELEKFKKFIDNIFSKHRIINIATMTTLKFLLNSYFNDWDTYLGKKLREISLQEIKKIYKVKDFYQYDINSSNENVFKNKFLNFFKEKDNFYYKVACINGMLLQLLTCKFNIEEDFDMDSVMKNKDFFQYFVSFKVRIIQISLTFGYRFITEIGKISQAKKVDSTLIWDENVKKKIVMLMSNVSYEKGVWIIGRLTINMVIAFAGIGLCYYMGREERRKKLEETLSLIDFQSDPGSEQDHDRNFGLLNDDEFLNGDFVMFGGEEIRINLENNFFV